MTALDPALVAFCVYAERETIERALADASVPAADIEDLTQIVVMIAVQAAQEERLAWTERPALRAWLRTTAWRRGRTYVESAAAREKIGEAVEIPDAASPAERYEAREELRRVVGRFNRSERALMAALAGGATLREIARTTGEPYGTIATRVRRIRRLLRRR